MREQKATTIDEIRAKLKPGQKETVDKLRDIVKKTLPEVEDTVKWGNVTFLLKGNNVAWIIIYRDLWTLGSSAAQNSRRSCLKAPAKA
jgi:uncharacterized protein YdhG (YjbR/CyaY superfamily)